METPHDRSKRLYELSQSFNTSSRKRRALPTRTELDVLIELNQFIRTDLPTLSSSSSSTTTTNEWETSLAVKYYNSLFREYAVADLKKYKTKGIALRWRNESEVMNGIGQQTCGSLRCEYHLPTLIQTSPRPVNAEEDEDDDILDPLVETTLYEFQVPFKYEEEDWKTKAKVKKTVLVKLIVCERCEGRMNYLQRQKKKEERRREREEEKLGETKGKEEERHSKREREDDVMEKRSKIRS
jgi:protein FRA10AC1